MTQAAPTLGAALSTKLNWKLMNTMSIIPVLNQQPIAKREYSNDGSIQIHSIFKTIQGEGPFCGRAAVFVRLWGCNLQCPGCDTEYTKHRTQNSHMRTLAIVQAIAAGKINLVVITGGEPFRQNLYPLVRDLVRNGFTVQIETNGTLSQSNEFYSLCKTSFEHTEPACFIVCSPKTGKVNLALQRHIAAYKYVARYTDIDVFGDGLPEIALGHTASPKLARPHEHFNGPVYLQPCDDKDEDLNKLNLDACIQSVQEFGYNLQLQIHKLIGAE